MTKNVRSYTQEFACLSPRLNVGDAGVTYTITVTASTPKQAQRRIDAVLYGNSCITMTKPTARRAATKLQNAWRRKLRRNMTGMCSWAIIGAAK